MADGPPPLLDPKEVRRRQQARAVVMALILGAFVILFFGISIAKIAAGHR